MTYLWWNLCTSYLLACQLVRVTVGGSGLLSCRCVMSFERQLTPSCVDWINQCLLCSMNLQLNADDPPAELLYKKTKDQTWTLLFVDPRDECLVVFKGRCLVVFKGRMPCCVGQLTIEAQAHSVRSTVQRITAFFLRILTSSLTKPKRLKRARRHLLTVHLPICCRYSAF